MLKYKLLDLGEIEQLKVGDEIKINDVETEVLELDLVGKKCIGFTTKMPFDTYPNKDQEYFWGKHTSTYEVYKLTEETTMNKQFTKADLKTGMRLVFKGDKVGVVLLGLTCGGDGRSVDIIKYIGANDGFDYLYDPLDDTTAFGEIKKVLRPIHTTDIFLLTAECVVVWEREVPKSREQIAYDEALEAVQAAKEAYELAQKKLEALNPANK